MKRFLTLAVLVTVACAAIMSSCKKDDPMPEISIATQPTAPEALTEGRIAGSLTVAATVTEGAALTYQWYSAESATNANGTAIDGATEASFALPASLTAGTYYYFCEVGAERAKAVRTVVVTVEVGPAPRHVTFTEGETVQRVWADSTSAGSVSFTTLGAWSSTVTETDIESDDATRAATTRADATWLSIDPSGADEAGDYTIGIALEPNYTGADRRAVIAIVPTDAPDSFEEITITQSGTTEDGQVPVAPTYSIAASGSASFGSRDENYSLPTAQTVTITNTGSGTVTLTQPTAVNFTIGALSTTELAAEEKATFTIQPKAGLAKGTYNETITIDATDGASASVGASFSVTEPYTPPYTPPTPTAPVFTTNPLSQTVEEGETPTFSVAATGATSYEWEIMEGGMWYKLSNNEIYTGVKTATLTVISDSNLDGLKIRCVATNAVGSTISDVATLTVTAPTDNTKPTVVSVSPDGWGAPLIGNVAITFSEAMDADNDDHRVYLTYEGGATVDLTGSWSAGNTVFTAQYTVHEGETLHTVNISGFKDANGNVMEEDNTHTFLTMSAPEEPAGNSGSNFTGGGGYVQP
ncbi:MAG: hypothetical protein LBV38_03550 [Alistipes sp.]|nr:hypothetical protein [Alistipes sp.]